MPQSMMNITNSIDNPLIWTNIENDLATKTENDVVLLKLVAPMDSIILLDIMRSI
jgi:hypothetical protein